jgi:hypothetical protein
MDRADWAFNRAVSAGLPLTVVMWRLPRGIEERMYLEV